MHIRLARLVRPVTCLAFILFLNVSSFFLIAQSQAYRVVYRGGTFIRNYTSEEYDHQPQNWSVVQNRQGVIYIGNQAGLLEYDGSGFRIVYIPNLHVRSLLLGKDGNLYMGGKREFGFLDKKGAYTSLSRTLEEDKLQFSTVLTLLETSQGIYFYTAKRLFRLNRQSGKISDWQAENRFHTAFVLDDTLYIRQPGVGLMWMKEDRLEPLKGGEFFADKRIYLMIPFLEKVLIGTRSHGFFIYDGNTFKPFNTGADAYLLKHRLYHGTGLKHSPGQIALATLSGGLVIIDNKGKLIQTFDTSTGLLDNTVYYAYEDRRGNLWLALNKGISKIEWSSPFTIFKKRNGLPGFVLSVANHGKDSRLYAGTDQGLFYYAPGPPGRFLPVSGVPGYCWSLLSIKGVLLAATTGGAYMIEYIADETDTGHKATRLSRSRCFVLAPSAHDSNRIWCGTNEGLGSLYREAGNSWKYEGQISGVSQSITTIAEEPGGQLWLGVGNGGVLKASFPLKGSTQDPAITRYTTAHGLPEGEIAVYRIAGHLMLATREGLYRRHLSRDRFVPDDTLGKRFAGGGDGVFRMAGDKEGHFWIHSRSLNFRAIPQTASTTANTTTNTFRIEVTPFRRLSLEQVNSIYPGIDGNLIWFARHDGLYGFDKSVEKNYRLPFTALIREVYVEGETTFFNEKEFEYKKRGELALPVIPFQKRNLRFRFAAPFFENESATRFSFKLEGYDKKWSPWTAETRKDYTNLDPGFHRFRVRARNIYGHMSSEAVYEFKISPPWYRTWWAWSFYILCVLLLFYGAVKWRYAWLEKERTRLENLVRERTREVRDKNRQLREMARVKSRFFANISHEFRTPLTLIMGPLEGMSGKPFDSMLHNTRRLLNLIDQLLELSKIESGKMKLKAAPQDVAPFLKGVLSSFEMEADLREVELIFAGQPREILLYFDVDVLDKIICNLLSNALKFTPGGGTVTLSAVVEEWKKEKEGHAVISVRDTGPGIPPDQLPHVFDRFYQAGTTQTYEGKQKGSGIGLALVKELVTLHHGRIEAFSDGKGSRFILHLPLGRDHFQKEEIIDMPETFPRPRNAGVIDESPGDADGEEIHGAQAGEPVILVVEDNAEMRHYIAESLQDTFTVIQATDGNEGIQKARESVPDLIISDIMMPHTDGYQLCATLKKDVTTSHIPIILLTAKASDENIIKGLETGSDDYITKPFNAKILNSRVKNLIEMRRDLQERIRRDMLLQPVEISVSSVDETFLKELQELIEKNLSDSGFNVEALAGKLYMSRASLYRKILALTGQSPNHFIRSYRLKRAAQLLRGKFGNVTEVAMEVGFSNMAHFAKCFKEAFHQLPSTYQSSGLSE